MAEYRSNLRFVPRYGSSPSIAKCRELVFGGRGRFGRKVVRASSERALATADVEHLALVADALGETVEKLSGSFPEAKLAKLSYQRDILRILMRLGKRKMHVHELAALLAFVHGFTPRFYDHLNAAGAIYRSGVEIVKGDPYQYSDAAKKFIRQVHNVLLKNTRVFTMDDIARAVGVAGTAARKYKLNLALAVLDTMGLVRKLPVFSTGGKGGMAYVYLHEEHALNSRARHLTVPHWNYSFQILKRLSEEGGEVPLHAFRSTGSYVRNAGVAPVFSASTMSHDIPVLESVGLVKSVKRSGNPVSIALTRLGTKLMNEVKEKNELPEELRLLLLGQASAQGVFNPRHEKLYLKTVEWLSILRELTKTPRRGSYTQVIETATLLGKKVAHVQGVAQGKMPFKQRINLDRMEKKFLPRLEKEYPELARVFREYLASRGFAYGEKAFTA